MPRYELKDDKSSKFWEIEVTGESYQVRYGRIGSDGQTSTKQFDSAAEAREAADRITESKIRKGYRPVDDQQQGSRNTASNPELEQMLIQNPDDTETWQVYADYLQAENDPLGEMIALGVAIEQSPGEASSLQQRFQQVLEDNKSVWFGVAAPYLDEAFKKERDDDEEEEEVIRLQWKHGMIRKLWVGYYYDFPGPATHELLAALLRAPAARLVQEVAVGVTEGAEDAYASFKECIDEIAAVGVQPNLRRLTIGDFGPEDCEISWSSIDDLSKLYPLLPNLEFLRIHGGGIVLGELAHQRLKTLIIETGGLSSVAVRSIVTARLPALEKLEVWFGAEHYGADSEVSMLAPLFDGAVYPALKSLGLKNCEYQNEIVEALAVSPLLKRLRSVDLSMGTMTDDGAKVLLEHAERFEHLERIDLDDNYISDETADALRRRFGEAVSVEDQDTYDDEDYIYVSVGE